MCCFPNRFPLQGCNRRLRRHTDPIGRRKAGRRKACPEESGTHADGCLRPGGGRNAFGKRKHDASPFDAAPPVRVCPSGWAKPLAQRGQCRPARAQKAQCAVKTPRKCGLPDRAGRSLPAAEARSLRFAALRRLQPANLSGGFISTQTFSGDLETTTRWGIHSPKRIAAKERSVRMPVEAAGSERGSRQQEETATRGEFIHLRAAVFACRRTTSPAQPAPQEAAAAPNVRVRPRGWAKPLAQGAQCPQNTAQQSARSAVPAKPNVKPTRKKRSACSYSSGDYFLLKRFMVWERPMVAKARTASPKTLRRSGRAARSSGVHSPRT